jgi:MSHA biogenesis protein MshJ
MSAANPVSAYWQRYLAWFAARQPRERLIVAVAVLGGILFLGYSYAIEPALLESRRAARSLAEAKAATAQAVATADVLAKQNLDPDAPLRAELAGIANHMAEQSQRFEAVDRSLVPPAKVPALLESLLRSRTLQLVSLRTLPPAPVIERKAAKAEGTSAKPAAETAPAGPALPNLFKHGVEIRIAGSYADLLGYLSDLESSPQRLIWGRMDLAVAEYPRSVLTLTVYTLSLEKSWLVL